MNEKEMNEKELLFEEVSENELFADYTADCSGGRSDCCTRVCTSSNKNVINLFKDNLEIIYDKRITYKTNIYNLEDFIKMTPLTSGLSKEQINELNKCDIEKITVDLKIIVGKVK